MDEKSNRVDQSRVVECRRNAMAHNNMDRQESDRLDHDNQTSLA